jgi:hypothetical protein
LETEPNKAYGKQKMRQSGKHVMNFSKGETRKNGREAIFEDRISDDFSQLFLKNPHL